MLCISFRGKTPTLKSGSRIAPTATIIGDVTVEKGASIWYGASVRGDLSAVSIGESSNVQDNAVIHTNDHFSVSIGNQVTIGHGAIIHGCTIENNCLIGMGAVLLDGCVIGEKSLVGAGALVTQGAIIPPGSLVVGSPARVKRPLTPEELAMLDTNYLEYVDLSEQLEETP